VQQSSISRQDYRTQINALHDKMIDGSHLSLDMVLDIQKMHFLSRTLLALDLHALNERCDNLKKTDPYNKQEINKLTGLIQAVNSLLNYPNTAAKYHLFENQDCTEAQDIKAYVARKAKMGECVREVKRFLETLSGSIHKRDKEWRKKIAGINFNAYPEHIKEMVKVLAGLPQLVTEDDAIDMYVDIMKIFRDVSDNDVRHDMADAFHRQMGIMMQELGGKIAENITAGDAQILLPMSTAAMQRTMVNQMYPAIKNGDQIVMPPVYQSAAVLQPVVPQTAEPVAATAAQESTAVPAAESAPAIAAPLVEAAPAAQPEAVPAAQPEAVPAAQPEAVPATQPEAVEQPLLRVVSRHSLYSLPSVPVKADEAPEAEQPQRVALCE
jgi:hypothetical protein